MKNIFKYLLPALAIMIVVASCKKDEHQITYEGGTAPVLTSTVGTTNPIVLDINNKNSSLMTFAWTNPNYKFTTGVSSQDVFYTVQFDTTVPNFTGSKLQEVAISKDLSSNFTVGALNSVLLTMGLAENMPHDVYVRVKAALVNNSAVLYSNVLKYRITPYLDVKYPVPAALYITGSATPASWQCGCGEAELLSQKFTKINSSTFKLTIALSANNSYLFLPVYGSWSAKYGGTGGGNSNNVNGDDFKPEGSDLKAPATSGTYTITVDFKTGKFTVQ